MTELRQGDMEEINLGNKRIAIYHRVMKRETFEVAAKDLFTLIQSTQKTSPGKLVKKEYYM